jgi:hypothetical protein
VVTCNDFDCVLQQVAAIEAGTLVILVLLVPLSIYGHFLFSNAVCKKQEQDRRYKIGLEIQPTNYHFKSNVAIFIHVSKYLFPPLIVIYILQELAPEEWTHIQPLKWIL